MVCDIGKAIVMPQNVAVAQPHQNHSQGIFRIMDHIRGFKGGLDKILDGAVAVFDIHHVDDQQNHGQAKAHSAQHILFHHHRSGRKQHQRQKIHHMARTQGPSQLLVHILASQMGIQAQNILIIRIIIAKATPGCNRF